ncbi:hypothetical protein L202_03179 [Cryptococcus amylolentus CBS 6039]|uniref:Uncharacterized protein n=1 Tax=Cryptococcus amylolentus CBS 6039 TaxID=1295533 RepID=A0A1E3HXN8_9TREE|nr:hypothetical protein L202_03179 [Cryptococcus amylolentus CBS 6039]ODN81084.1 hypothetical protein L202_03179 [Cryptococcus amylolentus CBS 6039]
MPSQPDANYDVSDRFEEDLESIAISLRGASGSAFGEMGQHGYLDPATQPVVQQLVTPSRVPHEQPPYPRDSPAFRAPPYQPYPPAPNTYSGNTLRTFGSSSSMGFEALNQPSLHYKHPIDNAGIPGASHLPGTEQVGVGSSVVAKRGRESETMTAYSSKKKSATFDQWRGEWGGRQTVATMGSAAGSTVAHQDQSNPPSTSTPFPSSIDSSAVPHPIATSDAFPFGPLQSGSGINTTPSEIPSLGSSVSVNTFRSAGIGSKFSDKQQWGPPPGFLRPQQTSGLDMMGRGGDFDVAGRDMGTLHQQDSGHGREMGMGGVGRPEGGAYQQAQHQGPTAHVRQRPSSVSALMAPNQNQQSDSGIGPSYVPPSYFFGLPDPEQPVAPPAHNSSAVAAPHFDQTFLEDTASAQAAGHASALSVTLPQNSSQYAHGLAAPPAGSAPDAASRSAVAEFMQPPPTITQGNTQEQAVAPFEPSDAPHPGPTHFSPSKSKAASDKEALGYDIIGIGETFPPRFNHTPAMVEAFNTLFSTVYSDIYAQHERQTPQENAEKNYTKTAKGLRDKGETEEWSIHEAMRQTEIKSQDEVRALQESALAQQQIAENIQQAGQVDPPAPAAHSLPRKSPKEPYLATTAQPSNINCNGTRESGMREVGVSGADRRWID